MVHRTSGDGLPPKIVEKFNAADDLADVRIALGKKEIELLINTLAELHKSYASLLRWPIIVDDDMPPGLDTETDNHAKRSYGMFVELATNLMAQYLQESDRRER